MLYCWWSIRQNLREKSELKMRKHLISLLLALAVCAGLLCVPAYASSGDFTIENGVLTKYTGSGGNVTIPDSVTKIGGNAFAGCASLTSVAIPNSVTKIGDWAFSGCTSLTSVTIPDSVTEIGWDAFNGCTSLTSVTIPDSVTEIGDGVFNGCTRLTIYGDAGSHAEDFAKAQSIPFVTIFVIDNGTLTKYNGVERNVVIPNGVTKIGQGAFLDCTGLTSVAIPDSVTEIGPWAFKGCTSLTSVTIPNGVTTIYDYAFFNCTGLTSITIPDSMTEIEDFAFADCTSLTDVYYAGSEEQWEHIEKDYNAPLSSAKIHYNSAGQPGNGEASAEAGKTGGFPVVPVVVVVALAVGAAVFVMKKKGQPAAAPTAPAPAPETPPAPAPVEKPAATPNFCPNCGQQLEPGAKFCPNCGNGLTGGKN